MRAIHFNRRFILVTALLVLMTGFSKAQTTVSNTELFKEILKQDSILFTAFNKRDTAQFSKMFSKDLEFYHDKGGLTGYDHTIDFLKRISVPGNLVRRELDKESMEVYPVPGYGAIQVAKHRFCNTENGKETCGLLKFLHIWQQKEGEWKITRVVSYDH